VLRLIVKVCPKENGRFSDDESINLKCYKVFEVEHDDLEDYITEQRDNGQPIKLVAIEVFEQAPLPLATPVFPEYKPSDTSPAAQNSLMAALAAKHKPANDFWGSLFKRKRYVPPLNLPK